MSNLDEVLLWLALIRSLWQSVRLKNRTAQSLEVFGGHGKETPQPEHLFSIYFSDSQYEQAA